MAITLAAVATEFIARRDLSASTVRSYESVLVPLLVRLGAWPIRLLERGNFEEYLTGLEGLHYTTHRRHQATLVALLNFSVDQGYLPANPIARLSMRKPLQDLGESETDEPIRYLDSKQLDAMYGVVKLDPRLHTAVHLLHQSGARVSEVLGLNLEEIDLEGRKFQLLGKGNRRRWAFFGTKAAQVLKSYLKFERHGGHPALFTARQPKTGVVSRLAYATLYRDWSGAIIKVDMLVGTRLHDLRHTFATERVGLMQIEELRALMGHTNIQTTLRYQKVTSARAEAVAQQALERLRQADE